MCQYAIFKIMPFLSFLFLLLLVYLCYMYMYMLHEIEIRLKPINAVYIPVISV